jgi:hypothetical protein
MLVVCSVYGCLCLWREQRANGEHHSSSEERKATRQGEGTEDQEGEGTESPTASTPQGGRRATREGGSPHRGPAPTEQKAQRMRSNSHAAHSSSSPQGSRQQSPRPRAAHTQHTATRMATAMPTGPAWYPHTMRMLYPYVCHLLPMHSHAMRMPTPYTGMVSPC